MDIIAFGNKTKIKILQTGDYEYAGNPVSIDEQVFEQMLANFENRDVSAETLPVVIGHQTDDNSGQEAVAWIEDLEVVKDESDESLWLEATVDWTDEEFFDKLQKKKNYKYCSIEAVLNDVSNKGQEVGAVLTGLALTNHPFVSSMPELTLSTSQNGNKTGRIYLSQAGKKSPMNKSTSKSKSPNKIAYADAPQAETPAVSQPSVSAPSVPENKPSEVSGEPSALLKLLREAMGVPEMTEAEALKAVADLLEKVKSDKPSEEKAEVEVEVEKPADEMMAAEGDPSAPNKEMTEEEKKKAQEEADKKKTAESGSEGEVKASSSSVNLSKSSASTDALVLNLSKENSDLKAKLDKYVHAEIEAKVMDSIALGKISASQKDVYVAMAKERPDFFEKLIGNVSPGAPSTKHQIALGKSKLVSKGAPAPVAESDLLELSAYGKMAYEKMKKAAKV